jgi:hypothetical protein
MHGNWYQSHADAAGNSLLSYIHAIFGLLVQTGARRILLIGGAGGTLGTMLARIGKQVTIVDIDPDAFVLARTLFKLPPEIECHVADGRAFLEETGRRFDAIVVDAYARNVAPPHLCTFEFFRLARRRLSRNGCILVNAIVADDDDPLADLIAAGIAKAGLPTCILDARHEENRNAIVIGGSVGRLTRPTLLLRLSVMADDIKQELRGMSFRARRTADPLLDEVANRAVGARRSRSGRR